MRGGSKTLVVTLAALLIVAGLAACGSGNSSSSTTTAASQTAGAPSKGDSAKGDKGESGSGGEGKSANSGPSASEFTPRHHSDSGGGSKQFEVKGGDNSVQEFGEEAGASEFAAAAAALHDFLDARAEGNWAAACEYMSKGTIESFEKLAARAKRVGEKSCAAILENLTNPAAKGAMKAEAEKADVGSLRTKGEQSFLIYTGTGGAVLAMPMANEGGDWKVASLAGTPLN